MRERRVGEASELRAIAWLRIAAVWIAVAIVIVGSREVAHAQARGQVSAGAITILTDALDNPASRGTQLVNELAAALTDIGKLRVLALAGQGGEANVRDLLYLRGVEFALMNADAIAHLQLVGRYPEASDRVRSIAQLYTQRILLFARRGIRSPAELAGRKVAILSRRRATRATAETLFKALGVAVDLQSAPGGARSTGVTAGADAVLLLESELAETAMAPGDFDDFRLIPIAPDRAVTAIYNPASVEPTELAGLGEPRREPVATVAVPHVLAVFNWRAQSPRMATALNFVDAFLRTLPELRDGPNGALWRQVDVTSEVPGLPRHPSAAVERFVTPAAAAQLALVAPSRFAVPDQIAGRASVPATAATTGAIAPQTPPPGSSAAPRTTNILAIARSPLADTREPNGGLAVELANLGLAEGAEPPGATPNATITWITPDAAEIVRELESNRYDVVLPLEYVSCGDAVSLTSSSAFLCDQSRFTEPLLTVIIGLFVKADSGIDPAQPATLEQKRICVPEGLDQAVLGGRLREYEREFAVEIVRQGSIVACLGELEQGAVDAMVANEIETRHAMKLVGVGDSIRMADQPIAISAITAAVPNARPDAAQTLQRLNRGIRRMRDGEVYGNLLQQRLGALLGTSSKTSAGDESAPQNTAGQRLGNTDITAKR